MATEGHPNRPFKELSDNNQHTFLTDALVKYVDEWQPPTSDLYPTYERVVVGWPNFVIGFNLLESAFKFLIRSRQEPQWDSQRDRKKDLRLHDLADLYGLLDEQAKNCFDSHFTYLRLSVQGWPNPTERLDAFLSDQEGVWKYRYALVEDTTDLPAYDLLVIRELCIASIYLLYPGWPTAYSHIARRIAQYKMDDIRDETEQRWCRAQGDSVSKPSRSPSTMRSIDLALWEKGVQTGDVYLAQTFLSRFQYEVEGYAFDLQMERLGIKRI